MLDREVESRIFVNARLLDDEQVLDLFKHPVTYALEVEGLMKIDEYVWDVIDESPDGDDLTLKRPLSTEEIVAHFPPELILEHFRGKIFWTQFTLPREWVVTIASLKTISVLTVIPQVEIINEDDWSK